MKKSVLPIKIQDQISKVKATARVASMAELCCLVSLIGWKTAQNEAKFKAKSTAPFYKMCGSVIVSYPKINSLGALLFGKSAVHSENLTHWTLPPPQKSVRRVGCPPLSVALIAPISQNPFQKAGGPGGPQPRIGGDDGR